MKTIHIVRHAKAEHTQIQTDHSRKLTNTGLLQCASIATQLIKNYLLIDAWMCSDAIRTMETAQAFAKHYNKPNIIYYPTLYHANATEIAQHIAAMPDTISSIILFAHNPGVTNYINSLQLVRIDNMPTCGLVTYTANCVKWIDVANSPKKFIQFLTS